MSGSRRRTARLQVAESRAKIARGNGEELMSNIAALVACLVLIAGPAAAQSKAVIQKVDDKWAEAFNKGDAAALAAMYTEDAYMLPPGAEMMKDRRAIAAFGGSRCSRLATSNARR